jgi:hypothetical protein
VGRALAELDIRWIPAHSPQATGRIERLWGTLQDRLVSELRRARAASLDKANAVLAAFLPRYNRRFITPPAHPGSGLSPTARRARHRPRLLLQVRAHRRERQYRAPRGHLIQILPGPGRRSYAKARVEVHEHLDGTLSVVYQGQPLTIHCLTPTPTPHEIRARQGRPRRTPPTRAPSGQRVDPHARTPALEAGAGPSLASIRARGTAKESTQRGRSVIFVEQIR